MKLGEHVRIAYRSVRSNRLRTALTTLGVVIGVSAVIVLVGFGDGLKAGFATQFGALGTQLVVTKVTGSVPGGQAAHELTDADAAALTDRNKAPDIAQVSGAVAGTALATYNQRHFRCALGGVQLDYLSMVNHDLAAGTFFTSTQQRDRARVVVLGTQPATTLFGPDPNAALGHRVRIGRSFFTVIGILSSNGQDDTAALMPLTTARANFVGGTDTLNQIIVRATSVAAVAAAQDQITTIISRRHNTRDTSQRDFEIQALQNLLEQATRFLGYLTLFTVAVAAISLLVGAIGIANIMLVSVTERTREIGIRKAIGATRRAILKQFLIESTVLGGIGGLTGVLIGIGVVTAGAAVMPYVAPKFGAPAVSAPAVLIAFTVSLAVGLLAGGYPALRAARLAPIEALRYE